MKSNKKKNISIPLDEFLIRIKILNSTFLCLITSINKYLIQLWIHHYYLPLQILLQDFWKAKAVNLYLMSYVSTIYVDIFLIAFSKYLNEILNIFNSLHTRVHCNFTVCIKKKSVDNHIYFLNIMIIIENKKIIFYLYHKSTFSGRYLLIFILKPPSHL